MKERKKVAPPRYDNAFKEFYNNVKPIELREGIRSYELYD